MTEAQEWGVGSTVDRLRRVFVRTPVTEGDFEAAAWSTPDPAALRSEHDGFIALLESLGCDVEVGSAVPPQVDAV